jgi:hypothetical protein
MTKSEIIKKLKPHCNGVVLPMSLNVSVIAELLKEEPECTLPPVSQQRELLLAFERWKVEKGNYPEYRTKEQMINDYLSQ